MDIPTPKIIIPEKELFEQFYTATKSYGAPVVSTDSEGNLALKAAWLEVRVSPGAVIELIAEKYNQKLPYDADLKIRSPPPFIKDIDEIIHKKMAQISFEFGCMTEMHDSKVGKLVYDYLRVWSYPLLVRVEYAKWKEGLTGYIVATAVSEMETQKNSEIREIRNDYDKKSKDDLSKTTLRINRLMEEVEKYKVVAHGLQDMIDKTTTDNENIRGEIESLHEKLSDAENLKVEYEAKWIEEKKERKTLEDKFKKLEGDIDWIADVTCSPTKPVFLNRLSSEVVELPCSMQEFKDQFKLNSSDGTERLYKDEAGKEVKIPEALALKMVSLIAVEQKAETKDEDKTKRKDTDELTDGDHKIWDVILDSEEPITAEEIVEKAGIIGTGAVNNLKRRNLYRLLKHGKIQEDVKEGKKVYSGVE